MPCPHPILVLVIWVKFQMVTDSSFYCSHQCCTPGNDHSLQPLPLVTPQVVGTPQSNNKPLMAISILQCITLFLRIAFSMQVNLLHALSEQKFGGWSYMKVRLTPQRTVYLRPRSQCTSLTDARTQVYRSTGQIGI